MERTKSQRYIFYPKIYIKYDEKSFHLFRKDIRLHQIQNVPAYKVIGHAVVTNKDIINKAKCICIRSRQPSMLKPVNQFMNIWIVRVLYGDIVQLFFMYNMFSVHCEGG